MKKSILIALLIINSFYMFAELPEEVQDLEKIRWVFCGLGYSEGPGSGFDRSDSLRLKFNLPPATKIYKYVYKTDYTYTPQDDMYAKTYYKGYSGAIFEYKKNYLFDNYYNKYTANDLDEIISKRKIPVLSINHLINTFRSEIVKADGSPVDFTNLNGTYLEGKTIYKIKTLKEVKYDGYVSLTDWNDEIFSCGGHYLSYDKETNSFVSEGTFKNEKLDCSYYDDFTIKIIDDNKNSKVLVLDTPIFAIPYVPMEKYFVPNKCKVTIYADYVKGKPQDIIFYEKSSEKSKEAFRLTMGDSTYLPVIDTVEQLVLKDDTISKWVKIRSKDGREGWIWGGKCSIQNKYNSSLDRTVAEYYQRFYVRKNVQWPVHINDSRVRLRTKPNLDSKVIDLLEKGVLVTVSDTLVVPYEIDGGNWYWYQVETASGKTGWVYGKYLDMAQ